MIWKSTGFYFIQERSVTAVELYIVFLIIRIANMGVVETITATATAMNTVARKCFRNSFEHVKCQ